MLDWQPAPLTTTFGCIESLLLGLAIGNALGNTSKPKNADEHQQLHGEIRDTADMYNLRYAESV